ncbi:autoinducer 2 ABC transporter substrate-binding protein [Microbacterium sp.]|jgi:simple sugar transport system substrate-binding protein|uniref:autoinducer 2 ABC transporter substrate-binding protein n=1 Tax=Microbacterium sp. TaxID=51671 RepID=UPI002D7855FF|nr:autoinducer 2 ABC transporter substrate-binding protein [Microbacterium sp.]HET6301421.1 autoinducer 2 ABC transporter substrate-binding protein [Microbacterium sp.]
MKRKSPAIALLAGATVFALAGCGTTAGGGSSDGGANSGGTAEGAYVTVVKATGIGWFDRMEVGVDEWADETGVDARQEGPAQATNEGQVEIIQNLIAQEPVAITVVPNDVAGLATVLGEARDKGIIVVAHEGAGMQNVDIDIEAFENKAYGAQIMDNLAECMDEEGGYVQFVGRLTNGSHSEWVQGALENQEANFPNLTRLEDPIESEEDEEVAYNKAKELLAKYPDIKGFQGSAGTDVTGIARAVEEAGKSDSVCVMGTSIPSVASSYLESGSIDKIFFWDPAMAGKAQLAIAKILAEGGSIEEGTDLGVPGYESLVKLEGYDNVFAGEAGVVVDASNVAEYDF